jgi:hypothetical protein
MLGKILFEGVMGSAVDWPEAAQIEGGQARLECLLDVYEEIGDEPGPKEDEELGGFLDFFPGADVFGLQDSLIPIQDATPAPSQNINPKKRDMVADILNRVNLGTVAKPPDISANSSSTGQQPNVEGCEQDPEQPSNKRGRKSFFNEKQKEWIKAWCRSAMAGESVPPIGLLRIMLEEGIAKGVLPENTGLEQVRHVARN